MLYILFSMKIYYSIFYTQKYILDYDIKLIYILSINLINMNNLSKVLNVKNEFNIDTIWKAIWELKNLEKEFLNPADYVKIKNRIYIKKSWYRKLALILGISVEVIKHERVNFKDYFVHSFITRATARNWRYSECSWACASNEKIKFNHLENDVLNIWNTRSISRSISDLLWLWEIFNEEINYTNINTNLNNYNNTSNTDITNKQKNLLIKLVESKYQDEHTRNNLYKKIDTLNKQEATTTIKQLIGEWVEI